VVLMEKIFRETYSNLAVSSLRLPAYSLHCIMALAEHDVAMHRQMCAAADNHQAAILNQIVFAGYQHYELFHRDMEKANWPISWLPGDACQSEEMLSMQALAISGINTRPIVVDNQVIGRWYEDDYARYCWLSNMLPQNKTADREDQAYSVFQLMNTALSQCDMQFTNIVRTWFFLDHILNWYDGFNRVRTRFLTENGVFEKILPASTGVGTINPLGAALIASAVAVKPKTELFTVQSIHSPLQSPACNYKSSFSRAVETACPTHRFLYISGTASINAEGISTYRGDTARQVEFTMQVVEALLKSRDMNWTDAFRGIIYFKHRQVMEFFQRYCTDKQIPRFPLAISCANICREELLFEIELDAVKAVE